MKYVFVVKVESDRGVTVDDIKDALELDLGADLGMAKVEVQLQDTVYTCNCKTPLHKAAPEMYEFIEMLTTVSGQANIAAGNVAEIVGMAREILNKARGES